MSVPLNRRRSGKFTEVSKKRLYAELVTDSLTEFSYDADLAGLNYNFGQQNLGVFVTLNGYNDKLRVLAHHVFEKAKTLQVKLDRLNLKKEEMRRDWENFFLDQPVRISDHLAKYLFTDQDFTLVEKLAELASELIYCEIDIGEVLIVS